MHQVREESIARSLKFYLLLAVIITLFFAGFLLGEDALGGGIRLDLYLYHGPAMFAFRDHPWKVVVADYSSATMPLFQILESLNPLLGHDKAFRALNLCLAFLIVGLFSVAIIRRYPAEMRIRWPAVLIGASFFISPYFRAETYWVSTDILPMLLLVLSALFLLPIQDALDSERATSPFFLTILIAVLTWSAFYCRQTYLFAPAYACILLRRAFKRSRPFTLLLFAGLSLPAVWLFVLWKGLNPPQFQHHQKLSLDGMVAPLSMIFVYSIPFFIHFAIISTPRLHRWTTLRGSWYRILAGWLVFLIIFHSYRFNAENQGGGLISKLLSRFGVPGAVAFLTCSFLGLLILLFLMHQSTWQGRIFVMFFLIPSFAMSIVYQRYYDPLLFIVFFAFMDRSVVRRFLTVNMAVLLMSFNFLLLSGALLYNYRTKPVFMPLDSSVHPWAGTPLEGKVR